MKRQLKHVSLNLDEKFLRNIVIAIGAIFVWRGMWTLLDLYLLPDNPILSSVVSIIIGSLLLFLPDFKEKNPPF